MNIEIELDEKVSEFLTIWSRITGKAREEVVLAIIEQERARLSGLFGEIEQMKETLHKEAEMRAQLLEKL